MYRIVFDDRRRQEIDNVDGVIEDTNFYNVEDNTDDTNTENCKSEIESDTESFRVDTKRTHLLRSSCRVDKAMQSFLFSFFLMLL